MRARIVYYLMGFTFAAFTLMNCGKDDGTDPEPVVNEEETETEQKTEEELPPVINASDFTATIDEKSSSGYLIGTITASADKGTLTFSLSAQSHAGAFVLNETTGELTVGDESHFVYANNPQLTATAVATAGTTQQNISITVNLTRLPDILFSGRASNHNNVPAYWKNGERTILVDLIQALAKDIAVAPNGDVYVAGMQNKTGTNTAILWKNDEETILGPPDKASSASAIVISGSDVYVAGSVNDGGNKIAIWKNGERVQLSYTGPQYFANIESLAIVKNENGEDELWGVGYTTSGVLIKASYIVIGDISSGPPYTANAVLDDLEAQYATDIATVGGDVWITLYESSEETGEYVAKYWKNDEYVFLGDGLTDTFAYGVSSAGTDVYIVGYENNGDMRIAKYWKDDIATPLPTRSSANAEAYAVRTYGDDIYILGRILSGSSAPDSAAIWKNGELIQTIPNAYGRRLAVH